MERKTKKVILIGEIQSGKSNLIEAIYKYADQNAPAHLEIGNGSIAQTKDFTSYNISNVRLKEYIFDNCVDGLSSVKLRNDLYDNNIKIVGGLNFTQDWTLDLEILDTPGFTFDTEDKIFEQCCEKLRETKYDVLIYVTSQYTIVKSDYRQKLYNKILSMCNGLVDNIVVLNTIRSRSNFNENYINTRTHLFDEMFNQKLSKVLYVDLFCDDKPIEKALHYTELSGVIKSLNYTN